MSDDCDAETCPDCGCELYPDEDDGNGAQCSGCDYRLYEDHEEHDEGEGA
jgi:hypothetical protein